jgi:hypothetical protein
MKKARKNKKKRIVTIGCGKLAYRAEKCTSKARYYEHGSLLDAGSTTLLDYKVNSHNFFFDNYKRRAVRYK